MFISIFDLFKIGVGPSSSHTMGPMVAALRFKNSLRAAGASEDVRVRATFYGSLAFTGLGHASDKAVILGLLDQKPETLDPDLTEKMINDLRIKKCISLDGTMDILFDPDADIFFDHGPALEAHPNGMVFSAWDRCDKEILSQTYFSVGGGFVLSADEIVRMKEHSEKDFGHEKMPYPYNNAAELLEMGERSGLSIAQIKEVNEKVKYSDKELNQGIEKIWSAMRQCMDRGLNKDGLLPGRLKVQRRAANIQKQLRQEQQKNSQTPHVCNEWLSLYAMAVNEENASGGRVVTAPTNGAAGVIPAVLRYYLDFIPDAVDKKIPIFLLTAAAVGGIIKRNASISGAEVGCQGEVGSASSMAAAGLCAVMGGTNKQIENAAEIALEHHLGMTCDPVAGLVQVPCIERNGLGAVKAVTASALALRGDGEHLVSLDSCIETMRQTGMDMRARYKETSRGGLAVNVIEC